MQRRGLGLTHTQKQKLCILQMLPGLGSQRAASLMREFAAIKNMANQESRALRMVPGIGRKVADSIYYLLNDPF